MRVLHIHDQAGVSCILSKYLLLKGIDSKVIIASGRDKFGIKHYYKDYITFVDKRFFLERCTLEAENADIIHIHSLEHMVIFLRKKFGDSKKIFLHYHGTDIRGTKNNAQRPAKNKIFFNIKKVGFDLKTKLTLTMAGYFNSLHNAAQKSADAVLVSTKDLLPLVNNGIFLPNPIDLDHFTNKSHDIYNKREALTINNEATNMENSLAFCKRNHIRLNIDIYDRINKPIMYNEMPNFLRKYKIYVDIRFVGDNLIQSLSKTALESLACGLTVLDYELKYSTGLPKMHNPYNVVDSLLQIYSCNK